MAINIKSWKSSFLKGKVDEREDAFMVAQRFINVFRQLSLLGDSAVERYNKEVLEKGTPDVLLALTSLPGGDEIREYVNFLRHNNITNTEEEGDEEQRGEEQRLPRLPKAEELSPLWETMGSVYGGGGGMSVAASSSSALPGSLDPNTLITQLVEVFQQISLKQSQALLEATQNQTQSISDIIKYIIVDSDIERMRQNLKQGAYQVEESQEVFLHELSDIFAQNVQKGRDEIRHKVERLVYSTSSAPVETISAPGSSKETYSTKKTAAPVLTKRKKGKVSPKFSVRLIDEES